MAAAVATPFSGDALQHNFAVPAYNQVPETKEEREFLAEMPIHHR